MTEQSGNEGDTWFGDLGENAELSEWVSNKGYESPEAALTSHMNLEKLMGADKAGRTIVLPKDETDADGMAAFRAKLGVPDDPTGYELPIPEGQSEEFATNVASWFHESGVPKSAAQAVATKWNEFFEGAIKAQEDADIAASEKAMTDLKNEWGDSFKERSEFAKRGQRAYGEKAGLDENDLNALEQAIGTAKMMRLFHALGETTKEHGMEPGSGTGQFSMTPAEAQAKLDELRMLRADNKLTQKQWDEAQEKYGPILDKRTAA